MQVRLARQLLPFEGVSAQQVAEVLHTDVAEIRDGRRRLGRDPEVGGPRGYPTAVDPLAAGFAFYERLVRGNRGVGL